MGHDKREKWKEFPSIRNILQRWGVITAGASRSAVTDLGIEIEKVIGVSDNVADAIEGYCQRHPIDMIVLATSGRDGVAAWLQPSKAEQIAEKVSSLSIPTLFVSSQARGCVDLESGAVAMDQVLIPVDHHPDSKSAVERGLRAILMFGGDEARLTLLHVGTEAEFPLVRVPSGSWHIDQMVRDGNAAKHIVAAAEQNQANLIIMVTEGTQGLLDVFARYHNNSSVAPRSLSPACDPSRALVQRRVVQDDLTVEDWYELSIS